MHILIYFIKSEGIIIFELIYIKMRYSKEYLQRCGPVIVPQAGQRFFSGQDVHLRPFPCPRHTLTRPVQQSGQSSRYSSWSEKLLPRSLLFVLAFAGDKLKRVAEYSKAWHSFIWAVIYKLMAQPVATLATQYLVGSESLHHLGDAVLPDGFSESWPGRRVCELGPTGEQWVVTLGAHIHAWFEMILVDLAAQKLTERHAVTSAQIS